MHNSKLLLSSSKIQTKIKQLAKQISNDLKNQEIDIICILNGAIYFATDLAIQLKQHVHLHFVKASSYVGQKSTGIIQIDNIKNLDLRCSTILILDDILDTGLTMSAIHALVRKKYKSKNIYTATLLKKNVKRDVEFHLDYYAIDIENQFVYGYGLDLDGKFRNISDIRCVL